MDKIIAIVTRHKVQLKWAVVGVLAVLIAYYSVEALMGLVAILFGSQVHTSKKQQAEHRERIKDVVEQQQEAQEDLEAIRKSQVEAVTKAKAKAASRVDDFIDGDWP